MNFRETQDELLKRGYRRVTVPESRIWGDKPPTIVLGVDGACSHDALAYLDSETPASTRTTHD